LPTARDGDRLLDIVARVDGFAVPMTAAVTCELRLLARSWYLWALPLVVGYLSWRLLALNTEFHETFIDFDPQPTDDVLATYRHDVLAVYTSGFACGQLLSMLAGLVLAVRQPPPAEHRWRDILAKSAVAALFATVLGITALVVAVPRADPIAHHHWGIGEVARRGVTVHQLTLADWSVRGVLAAGVVSFALWAVIGVGLGLLAGGWRRLAVFLGGYLVLGGVIAAVAYPIGPHLPGLAREVLMVPVIVLLLPVLGWGLLVAGSVDTWAWLSTVVTFGLAMAALAAGNRAIRRRAESRTKTPYQGGPG
jgi:hypothetical protein